MFKSRTLKLLKGLGNNSLDVTKDEKSIAIDNTQPLPISHDKKKDLLKLCEKNVIPDTFHTFYKSLPSIPLKKDQAPEPGESDSEIDEDQD